MRLAFEIEVPDGAVDKSTEAELMRSIKELTVRKLYAEQRITAREAAEMLGMSQIQLLDPHGLDWRGIFPAERDDDEDFAILQRWHKQHTDNSAAYADENPLKNSTS